MYHIFFKKGVLKGKGTMLPRGGHKKLAPPPTQMISYAPVLLATVMFSNGKFSALKFWNFLNVTSFA